MPEFYYEDFTPGEIVTFDQGRTITKDEIIAFAKAYDPQPFHLDDEAAKHSLLGGLAASGWHTSAILMRLSCDTWINRTASQGAPGIEDMKWARPVRPGSTLRIRRSTLDKRVMGSRPNLGLVQFRTEMLDENNVCVADQRHWQLITVRDPRPAHPNAPRAASPPPLAGVPVIKSEGKPIAAYLEDIEIGTMLELGSEHFTRESVIEFATLYDPQPFHLNDEAARASHFGRLAASGWHTGALWMKNIIATRERMRAEQIATGITAPEGGPSPGFTQMRWFKPVYPGDTISYATQSIEKRKTSKPGWGLVFSRNTGINQHNELVFEFKGSGFVRTRG